MPILCHCHKVVPVFVGTTDPRPLPSVYIPGGVCSRQAPGSRRCQGPGRSGEALLFCAAQLCQRRLPGPPPMFATSLGIPARFKNPFDDVSWPWNAGALETLQIGFDYSSCSGPFLVPAWDPCSMSYLRSGCCFQALTSVASTLESQHCVCLTLMLWCPT